MANFPKPILDIASRLEKGEVPEKATVRTFLEWFGAQRRGFYVVRNIRNTLEKLGIQTDPDFESAYIDELVAFSRAEGDARSFATASVPAEEALSVALPAQPAVSLPPGSSAEATLTRAPSSPAVPTVVSGREVVDPTQRIGKLASANNAPLTVKPDATLIEAVTRMLTNDFSQLPVMTNDRDVKGVISWESIGSRTALGRPCTFVRECMEAHFEMSADTPLFSAIDSIVSHEYVLIRGPDRRISGIVTTSDLSLQFLQLGEPFLLLGEIESHIRRLIEGRFTSAELEGAKNPGDTARAIASVSDLTFGEYLRLLEVPSQWAKLGLPVDQGVFVEQLERVRRIRNDIMHFDPDGAAPDDLDALRHFVRFMQGLRSIGLAS